MTTSSLTTKIIWSMILGALIGVALHSFAHTTWAQTYFSQGLFTIVGDIFITLLKMLVIPVVFVSIICGTSNLANPKIMGRIGAKTLVLYVCTTLIAIGLAILFSSLLHIGVGANFSAPQTTLNISRPNTFSATLVGLFTGNPIRSLAEGNLLQVIIFALLLGIAIRLAGDAGIRIKRFFDDFNAVVMRLVTMIIALTPYGVFALIAKLVMTTNPHKILYVFGYFFTVLLVLLVHVLLTNSMIVGVLARRNPWHFFKALFPVQLFAFSTASSNASIPLTLRTVQDQLEVSPQIAGFTIPLGATINMDGTAIMQGVATVFLAHVYNLDLSITQYLMVMLTATLSSIGTAGIPGIGLVTLTLVLNQVGLPVEGIALIIGIDRILDMVRTAVNVTGDAAVTVWVQHNEQP